MIITIGSISMNVFLLFRMMSHARSAHQAMESREGETRHESVLQYIEELRHELKGEKERFEARERELLSEIEEWKRKCGEAPEHS